jgi:multiple sugar transport system substrate-binding protein
MTGAVAALTWDHPRGKNPLIAASKSAALDHGLEIEWSTHSLEDFEQHPIGMLAEKYDVIVLDHPHIGDAIASGRFRSMDSVFSDAFLTGVRARSVGPSSSSYDVSGTLWALPLDAATQVAVHRAEGDFAAPHLWLDVVDLAKKGRVALSLAGPHAFLSFASMCVSMGEEPAQGTTPQFISKETGLLVLAIMESITKHQLPESFGWNPITLLERLAGGAPIDYVPLVYGYVNFAQTTVSHPLTFVDAPIAEKLGRHGSTLGGTGLAVTTRSTPSPQLIAHLEWLLSDAAQSGFIPEHDGQPAMKAGWESPFLNAQTGNFYQGTRATMDDAWIRPRFPGFTPFQAEASALIREFLQGHRQAQETVESLNSCYVAAQSTGK